MARTAQIIEFPKSKIKEWDGRGKDRIQDNLNLEDLVDRLNIVEDIDPLLLERLGRKVVEEYDIDLAEYEDERGQEVERFLQACDMKKVNRYAPFAGASPFKYPMLLTAVINYVSVALPAVYKDGEIAAFKVYGRDMPFPQGTPPELMQEGKISGYKEAKARRLKDLFNEQFKQAGFFNVLDRALHIQGMTGYSTIKTYWDFEKNEPCFEPYLPGNIIVNCNGTDYEDCIRATRKLDYYPSEIEQMIRMGLFTRFEYDELEADDYEEDEGDEYAEDGQTDDDTAHVFLEQHRLIDLDGDGYPEPYCVTVHKQSEKVVRVYARFNSDDITANEDGEIIYIEPLESYVKIPMIPDWNLSFHDKGLGDLTCMIQEGITAGSRMSFDTMMMGMMGGGIMSKDIKVPGGVLNTGMSEFIRADATAEQLANGIHYFQRPEPNPVIFNFIDLLLKAGDNLSIMKRLDIEAMPANMPATTALAAVDQGMQMFKAVFKRVYDSIDKILKIMQKLNARYLQLDRLPQGVELYEEDLISNEFEIYPAADPDISNGTKKYLQAQLIQGMLEDPYIDPIKARKTLIESVGLDADEFVKPPPPQQPDPMVLAQLELVKAQAALAQAQSESLTVDGQIKSVKVESDLANKESDTKVKEATVIEKMANATHKMTDAGMKENTIDLNRFNAQNKTVLDVAKLEHDREKSSRDHEFKEKESKKKNASAKTSK